MASNPSEEGNVGVQNGGASRSRGDGVGTSAIPNDDDEKSKNRTTTTDNDDSIMLVPQFIIKSFERTL